MRTLALMIGRLLVCASALMVAPGLLAAREGDGSADEFLYSAAVTFLLGAVAWFVGRRAVLQITPRLAFMLTTGVWLSVSLVSALPLLLLTHIGYTDAVFETISGLTTTGSTVLVGLDGMPDSLLLWRSLLQWSGGLGFTVMAVALMPVLGVGGMRLFRSENSDWSEKSMPRVRGMAASITLLYCILSALCAIVYWLAGMDGFDAINHAMTTLSTGGYSTHDASFAFFDSLPLQCAAVVFMMAGSLPFVLMVQAARGRAEGLLGDDQVHGLLFVAVLSSVGLGCWLFATTDKDAPTAFVEAAFNAVSVISTTGFASTDYNQWGSFGFIAFFYLMFVGGCSGSTVGGLKIFRFQIAHRLLRVQVRTLVHRRGVFPVLYNKSLVSQEIIRSLVSFSMAYFTIIGLSALVLAALNLDPITALTGSITAIGNVGPGLGELIGPAGNFSTLPDAAKWVLSFDMLLGRLEIMTVMVLMSAQFWRQ